MIHVYHDEETQVGMVDEGTPVVVFVGRPFGVDIEEHPLAGHLEDASSSPALSLLVAADHRLEGVAELMGDAVEPGVLHAVGCYPQGSDDSIVVASIGGAFERIVEHDHHAVPVGVGAWFDELELVFVVVVEGLYALEQVGQVHLHAVPVEVRRLAEVRAEGLFPKDDDVVSIGAAGEAPSGVGAGEVVIAQVAWDVDLLALGSAAGGRSERAHGDGVSRKLC